jgi:hypothetical protein
MKEPPELIKDGVVGETLVSLHIGFPTRGIMTILIEIQQPPKYTMSFVPFTTLPTVTETVDIQPACNPDYPPLVEYKFIFYKFPRPLHKNITSIQVTLLNDVLPRNNSLYISLYANLMQLTSPTRIYPNKYAEMIQFTYIPSQLTPDYQFQLMATIENMYLLNGEDGAGDAQSGTRENGMAVNGTEENKKEDAPTPSGELRIQLQVTTKYSVFNDTNPLDKLVIHHKYDNKTLIMKNGKMFCTKCCV